MIGVIGDLHLKEKLGYADYFEDKRTKEKEGVLNYIVDSFKDCDSIVFLGDQLNSRNNTSEVIKEFVTFVERFSNKNVYILAGNHEKKGDGKSAIDFMKEVEKPNWHIITDKVVGKKIGKLTTVFCPYFSKAELGVDTNEEGEKLLTADVVGYEKPDILFHHHAVTDTETGGGISTSIFDEIVLPKKTLEKIYKLVVGGHVHKPQIIGRTVVSGSVFTNEVGETEKFVYTIDEETLKVESLPLPVRPIHKLTDPTDAELKKIKKDSIVKVELTKKIKADELMELKEKLGKFDAYVMLENYPTERKKVNFEDGMLDFGIENLLTEYAKQNKISKEKLLKAWEVVR